MAAKKHKNEKFTHYNFNRLWDRNSRILNFYEIVKFWDPEINEQAVFDICGSQIAQKAAMYAQELVTWSWLFVNIKRLATANL